MQVDLTDEFIELVSRFSSGHIPTNTSTSLVVKKHDNQHISLATSIALQCWRITQRIDGLTKCTYQVNVEMTLPY
jgi:hypothetical protein